MGGKNPSLLRENLYICEIPPDGESLQRPCLCPSYLSPCGLFICCGGGAQLSFRPLLEGVISYVVADLCVHGNN